MRSTFALRASARRRSDGSAWRSRVELAEAPGSRTQPSRSTREATDFEDREGHRAPFASRRSANYPPDPSRYANSFCHSLMANRKSARVRHQFAGSATVVARRAHDHLRAGARQSAPEGEGRPARVVLRRDDDDAAPAVGLHASAKQVGFLGGVVDEAGHGRRAPLPARPIWMSASRCSSASSRERDAALCAERIRRAPDVPG